MDGDIYICLVESHDTAAHTAPSGWINVYDRYGTNHHSSMWYRFKSGSVSDPTFTHSGSSIIANCAAFRGANTTTPFDVTFAATESASDLTVETGAFVPVTPGAMILFAAHIANNPGSLSVTTSDGLTWTQSFYTSTSSGNDSGLGLFYADMESPASVGPIVATMNNNAGESTGALVALRPISASGAVLSIAVPTATVAGDLMIATIAVRPSSSSITSPAGWTLIRSTQQTGGATGRLATYWRAASAADVAGGVNYTWSFSGTHTGAVGGIVSYSGADTATPIDVESGAATNSSLSHSTPSVTTAYANDVLVTAHTYFSASSWAPNSGQTETFDIRSKTTATDTGITLVTAYKAQAAAGATGVIQATAAADADTGIAHVIALRKAVALTCYTDDFESYTSGAAPGGDWSVTSSGGSTAPIVFSAGGNKRLRLTDNAANRAGAAHLIGRKFPGSGQRIVVEFDHFAYNGSGADGIALTYSDASVTPSAGAYGGSLGYAQRTGVNGFAGGWIGIGIDEYGNYSNPTEGRNGGPGFRVDAVAVRGSGSGTTGYKYLAGSATLTPGIDNNLATTPAPGYRYRITLDHTNGSNAWTTIERDTGSGYVTVVPRFDAKSDAGQAAVPTNWYLSYTGSTGGSTNIHEIDNLTVCAASVIVSSAVNHYKISHSGAGITCEAEPVTIMAHDASHAGISAAGKTINISTSTGKGTWSASADSCSQTCYNASGVAQACTGTFTATTGNNGQASYLFATGEAGVRLCLKHNATGTVGINLTDGSSTEASGTASTETSPGTDPAIVFSDTGIRFYAKNSGDALDTTWRVDGIAVNRLGTANAAIAGVASNDATYHPQPQLISVAALKSGDTATARCVPLLGSTTRTLQFAYQCMSNPSTCRASGVQDLQVNGTAVTGYNAATTPTTYDNVNVTFDASGYGTIALRHLDVGQIRVFAKATSLIDATTGSTFNVVAGNSNTFTVKPYAFAVTGIRRTSDNLANPGAANAGGTRFMMAGDAFTATVTASAMSTVTAGTVGNATPSFGRCDSSGTTTCAAATEAVTLSSALVAPAGGNAGTLGGTTSANASTFVAGNGARAFTDLAWSEVGIMTLNATNANYLTNNLGTCAAQTPGTPCQGTFGVSGNVGRFYPHHFLVSGTTVANRSDLPTTTGSINAGSASLTVASASGIAIGDSLLILGAGTNGIPLSATVSGVAGSTVTLMGTAATAVIGTRVYNLTSGRDSFTYMGEPVLLRVVLSANNLANGTTQNYDTSRGFAMLEAANLNASGLTAAGGSRWFATGCALGTQCFGYGAIDGASQLTARLSIDTGVAAAASNWITGVGYFTTHLNLARAAAAPDGPYDALRLGIAPTDSDGVTAAVVATATVAGTNVFNLSRIATTTTGNTLAGSTALTVTSSAGIAVGHSLLILGAGNSGGPLQVVVAGVAGNTVTLASAANFTVSNTGVYNLSTIAATTTGSITTGTSILAVASAADIAVGETLVILGAGGSALWPLLAAAGTVNGTDVTLSPLDMNADAVAGNERKLLVTLRERYGRLRLFNAYGSELLPVQVPVRAEFFNGTGWQQNTLDNQTPLTPAAVAIGNVAGIGGSSLAMQTPANGVACVPATCVLANGTATLRLTPATAGTGWFDMALNLGSGTVSPNSCLSTFTGAVGGSVPAPTLLYLLGNWCSMAGTQAPNARIKFGASKAPFIFQRERY